jgi:autotransporter-associated beta strand protein
MGRRRLLSAPSILSSVIAILVIASPLAKGAAYTWQIASGDWSAASNWGGTLPTKNDFAYVADGGTVTISTLTPTCSTLALGSGSSGNVSLSAGSLAVMSYEYVGDSGAGFFSQSGGTNNSVFLVVGNNIASAGTYSLSGTGQLIASELIGNYGSGVFSQTAGTNNSFGLTVGYYSGSSGTYNLSGGSLSSNGENVGVSGTGSFTQSGGTHGVLDSIAVGYYGGSSGTYSLGGGYLSSGTENVGVSGTGSFIQAGGTNSVSNVLCLGYSSSSGTYILGSGSLSAAREEIGVKGIGSFIQTGGTNNLNAGTLQVGWVVGGSGSYSLSGTGLMRASIEYVGYGSRGAFAQSGGTNAIVQSLLVGEPAAPGAYSLAGSGLLSAAAEYVGAAGTGTFIQSGGTNLIAGALYLTIQTSDSATYVLSGNALLSATSEYVGQYGVGTFIQSGGTNTIGNALILGYTPAGTYLLNGGLLSAGSVSSSIVVPLGSSNFAFNGGTLQAEANNSAWMTGSRAFVQAGGAIIDVQGFNDTISEPLLRDPSLGAAADGGLTKLGAGTLTLSSTNTYTGNTYIAAGTVALGNSLALQNSALDTSGSGSLSFGTLIAATLGGLTGSGTISLANSASGAVALSVGNSNTNTTFSGGMIGPGSLTKIGSGTLLMTGSNSYAGSTTVSQGGLVVDGPLVSLVTVNSGGTLGGTGSLTSVTVNPGGHLAPGDPPGLLNIIGTLTLLPGAVMDYQLDTPDDSDEVYMPFGTLALNGQQFGDINFTPLAGFAPGDYTLIVAGTVIGSLSSGTSGSIDGYSANISVQGNILVLSVVPEPSALALLGTGAIILAGIVRRRRTAAFLNHRCCSPFCNHPARSVV